MSVTENSKQTETQAHKVLDSQNLFSDSNQVLIKHGEHYYRLCLTKENKLILTK